MRGAGESVRGAATRISYLSTCVSGHTTRRVGEIGRLCTARNDGVVSIETERCASCVASNEERERHTFICELRHSAHKYTRAVRVVRGPCELCVGPSLANTEKVTNTIRLPPARGVQQGRRPLTGTIH